MMSSELLEIHPQEIRFILEYEKPSSCSIRLANKSDSHVAFKVKTTSSTEYCVRPVAGVITPTSTSYFTVTMQPHTPSDFKCKDKFLVQSTIVPKDTKEEHITSSMFAEEEGKLVEEKEIKVILLCHAKDENKPTVHKQEFPGELPEDKNVARSSHRARVQQKRKKRSPISDDILSGHVARAVYEVMKDVAKDPKLQSHEMDEKLLQDISDGKVTREELKQNIAEYWEVMDKRRLPKVDDQEN